MEQQKHVVIVYPHPDDESFGAAGVIHQYRKQGVPVTYLCGTLGEMGRNMGTPPFANRETLPEIRKKELEEACKFLDIDFRLLGYRDKTIEFEDKEKVAKHIKEILEEMEPTLVVTHYPGHGVHPDHNALGEATIEAVKLMDEENRPTVWAAAITPEFERVLGEPDVVIPLDDEQFEFKLNAIMKHKSQAEGMLKKLQDYPDEMKIYLDGLKERLSKERFFVWKFD